MNKLKEYNIVFSGLKNGLHKFNFYINDSFFENFDYSIIKSAECNVQLDFNKQINMLILDFNLQGHINDFCDRCGDKLKVPIKYKQKIYYKFGQCYKELSDEIIIIPYQSNEINIAHILYEFICLSLPLKKEHNEGNCNKEKLNLLNKYIFNNKSISDKSYWENLKSLTK